MNDAKAKFHVGQLVHHNLFDYRGVIFDVDGTFQGTDEWYDQMARSKPPKDKPWYRVLVHNAEHETYVAERNLKSDESGKPINHPLIDRTFSGLSGGRYLAREPVN